MCISYFTAVLRFAGLFASLFFLPTEETLVHLKENFTSQSVRYNIWKTQAKLIHEPRNVS